MANFDQYQEVDSYRAAVENSIGFIGQNLDFFTEVKASYLVEIIRRYFDNLSKISVLDVGSGVGLTDSYLVKYIGHLYGADVSKGEIRAARKKNPTVRYQVYDGQHLPYDNEKFEVTFAINVLHHIPPGDRNQFLIELYRIIKPSGLIVIFEHNPLNPFTRKAVRACEFDEGVILASATKLKKLFLETELKVIENRFILFTPWRGYFFSSLDRFLGRLPLGAQHYIVGRKIK